jgi:hypothetical protein
MIGIKENSYFNVFSFVNDYAIVTDLFDSLMRTNLFEYFNYDQKKLYFIFQFQLSF